METGAVQFKYARREPFEYTETLVGALATVEGAAALAAGADVGPATLADRVASPGGMTREGLNVLDNGDALRALLTATLRATRDKGAALSKGA